MKNYVDLIGRTGNDVKTTNFENGGQVSKFSLATNKTVKKQEGAKEQKAVWHQIVAFGKLAEFAQQYVQKGELINVIGEIQYREYDDKEGNKKYITEIVADKIIFLSPKSDPVSEGQD